MKSQSEDEIGSGWCRIVLQSPPGHPAVGGCYRSHLRCIEHALNAGMESVLLLEDDAKFCEGFTDKAQAFFAALPDDWGMLYLGGQHLLVNHHPPKPINDLVFQPYNVNRTHAFALRGAMLAKVYKHLNRIDWQKGHHIDHPIGCRPGVR